MSRLAQIAARISGTLPRVRSGRSLRRLSRSGVGSDGRAQVASAADPYPARLGQWARLTRQFGEAEVAAFAESSWDFNPLHLDPEVAAGSRFGRPIAHGMLYASMFGTILGVSAPGAIYVSQSFRFKRPVYVGDTVTATLAVESIRERSKVLECSTRCEVDGVLVMDGSAAVMVPSLVPE